MKLSQRLQAALNPDQSPALDPADNTAQNRARSTPARDTGQVVGGDTGQSPDLAPGLAAARTAGAPPRNAAPDRRAAPGHAAGPGEAGQGGQVGQTGARGEPDGSDDQVTAPAQNALTVLKDKASALLFERLGTRLLDTSLDEARLHRMVQQELAAVVEEEDIPLTRDERQRLIRGVQDDVLGYGPLQPLLEDDDISEIMVNGPDMVYVEQGGRLTRSPTRFTSEEQLRRVIERIVSRVGRRVDESSPLVDARLEDGSRVNAIIPPLAVNGSSLTIRKFSRDPLKVPDLIRFGTLTPAMAQLLQACVQARLNIIISGGTGTGKTTLLNVLSSFIPHGERIITIEDAVELQLQQSHVVRLESRPANIEGRGAITIRDLVRNSLRMRPDRIVVGEVRGGETLDMLQAMNTGHDGSLSTVHANNPRDAISRMETLVLMAGMDLPLRAIREQVTSAIDLIVQLTRLRDGTRRVTHVTEVQGMEGDVVTLQDAFVFDYSAGVDAEGRFLGQPISTGVRPKFTERMADLGIELPAGLFNTPDRDESGAHNGAPRTRR